MILIISGTNRSPSKTLLASKYYAEELQKIGLASNLINLADLPKDFIFSALYENQGKNEFFNIFSEKVATATAYIILSPEYNGSFSGALKAFLDGLSYPNPMRGKPVLLTALSSGVMGGALALSHLTDVMHYLGAWVLPAKLRIPEFHQNFDVEKGIIKPALKTVFEEQLNLLKKFKHSLQF
jgi:NAD(P)H-dependent FMN reductase